MRLNLKRRLTRIASNTLLKMAKKTSALTSQVLPNNSEKVVSLLIRAELAWRQCRQARPIHNRRSASPTAIACDERFLVVEGVSHHISQFPHQPVLAVVVVEDHQPVTGQPCPCCLQRILSQQKAFKTQAGVTRGEGERIGQGEDNQVILLGRVLQEVAAIIDDNLHTWVLVGMIRMELDTKVLDCRINLHRCDRIDAIGFGNSDIRPGSCTEDQCVVERSAEGLVDELVKRLLVMPVVHRLMPSGVVHINDIAVRDSRMEQDFIVRRPVSPGLELSYLEQADAQDYRGKQHRSFGAEQQNG